MHKFHNTRTFFRSTTFKLGATYLAIIMLMSLSFSVVFYNTSSHQLGRQLPPSSWFDYDNDGSQGPNQQPSGNDVDQYLQDRIDEGRHALLGRLALLNVLALVAGAGLSYYLARRTLQPIEDSVEAQNRFVSDASHELRTPLTALQTTNEVALRKPKLSTAETRDLITHNIEEAAKLKALSDGLLGLLKQDNQKLVLTPTSLQTVVSDSLNTVVQVALAKKVAVHDQAPDIQVLADPQALTQVMTILLDNAVKYSKPKSEVFIKARRDTKYAYISVRDEGVGINATDLPHIFERFYRVDRSRSSQNEEGYGLGLSIAYKILLQLGGSISVTSTPSKGSTFTVKLPLAKK